MVEARVLEAGIRIGQLSAEPCSKELLNAALGELTTVIPCDAASIVLFDGSEGSVVSQGYDSGLDDALARIFPVTPWFRRVTDQALPPSISSEPDDDDAFRRDWFYETYLLSAGFRDGMGSAIMAPTLGPNRLLGTINLSCTREFYGLDQRKSLGLITTAIARLVDVSARLASQAGRRNDPSAIALISDRRVMPVPDGDARELLADAELTDVVRGAGPDRYEFLWSSATQWWRLVIEGADIPILGADTKVLRARPVPSPHGLSHREAEVLSCMALGMTNDSIARLLVLSPRTVHRHVENILRKTDTRTRAGAAALAWREHALVPRACLGGLDMLGTPVPLHAESQMA